MATKLRPCLGHESLPTSGSFVLLPRFCSGSGISPPAKALPSRLILGSPATLPSPGRWAAGSTTKSSGRSRGASRETTWKRVSLAIRKTMYGCRPELWCDSRNDGPILAFRQNRTRPVSRILFCGNEENRCEVFVKVWLRAGLGLPVFVIAQEVVLVPVVHCRLQEQPAHAQMSHLLEPAVSGVDTAADDAKSFALHLLAEQIIFGEGYLLVKSPKFPELP